MGKKVYSAPDYTFECDRHTSGYHGPSHLAVNVKCYKYPVLTGARLDKLKTMSAEDARIEERLQERAREDAVENWWEWARDRAAHYGLGTVSAVGRSGGWLCLDDWACHRLEELIEERETRCAHCDRAERDHVDDACLFGSTTYTPEEKLPASTREALDALKAYIDEINASMTGVHADWLDVFEQVVDDAYDDYLERKRRKPWPDYFMDIARLVATRATCDRKHVGAVIVRDNSILSTGYNGSISGAPHCDDVGHMMEDGHCVRTVHAEANAILQAARHGVRVEGATIYTTASPCWPCFQKIVTAGIKTIVFGELYRDQRIFDFAQQAGVTLVDMSKPSR